MDPIKTGHERPVNKQAALLLAKAPWWAHYPEPAKKAVLEIAAKPDVKWDDLLSYTNPPPEPLKGQQPLQDKRGVKLKFSDGSIGVVTGYASKRVVFTPRRRSSHNAKPGETPLIVRREAMNIHYWWINKNGNMFSMSWHGCTKKIVT